MCWRAYDNLHFVLLKLALLSDGVYILAVPCCQSPYWSYFCGHLKLKQNSLHQYSGSRCSTVGLCDYAMQLASCFHADPCVSFRLSIVSVFKFCACVITCTVHAVITIQTSSLSLQTQDTLDDIGQYDTQLLHISLPYCAGQQRFSQRAWTCSTCVHV